jgi:hypothetical protein
MNNNTEQLCVHCLTALPKNAITRDHVFPSSWYTDNTPGTIQRWTVPSCRPCNGKFGELEKELFIRLALCLDPTKAEASGINKTLRRSFGIGSGISEKEKQIRKKLLEKVLGESKPYAGEETFPGLGLHKGFPPEIQRTILFRADCLFAVLEKVFRGCEYVLNNQRYVKPPYSIQLYHVHEEPPDVATVINKFATTSSLGPGFEVKRAAAHDDEHVVLYKATVWGTIISYASINMDSKLGCSR